MGVNCTTSCVTDLFGSILNNVLMTSISDRSVNRGGLPPHIWNCSIQLKCSSILWLLPQISQIFLNLVIQKTLFTPYPLPEKNLKLYHCVGSIYCVTYHRSQIDAMLPLLVTFKNRPTCNQYYRACFLDFTQVFLLSLFYFNVTNIPCYEWE